MVVSIMLTRSRAALLTTVMATGLLLALWRPRTSLTFLGILGAAVLIWARVKGQGLDTYVMRAALTWDARLAIWSRAVTMITDFPLTGIGIGTFSRVMSAAYPIPEHVIRTGTANHAHNLLLQVGVDLGLPGLVAYLAVWSAACVLAWRTYREARRENRLALSALAAGVGTSLVVLAIHGLFDAVTWGTRPAFLAWAVMGLAIALHRVCCFHVGNQGGENP
jgi:O-antigen ligase